MGLNGLVFCSALVIHVAVGTAAYLNNDNLTRSDNCHVSYPTLQFCTWAIEFCLHTSPNIFPLISSSLTFVPDILQTHRLKIYLFFPPLSSFIFCWCNIFHPHSLSLFLLLSFSYIFLFTNRRTYIRFASSQQNNSSVATLKLSTSDAR